MTSPNDDEQINQWQAGLKRKLDSGTKALLDRMLADLRCAFCGQIHEEPLLALRTAFLAGNDKVNSRGSLI